MSTTSDTPAPARIEYIGDGIATAFTIPFDLYDRDDLRVFLNGLSLSSGYRLESEKIVFVNPPKPGAPIVLERVTTQIRKTRFRPHHEFRADVINLELDRLLAMIQDMQRQLDAKDEVQRPDPGPLAPSKIEGGTPLPKPEPGKLLGWTEAGIIGNFEAQLGGAGGINMRFHHLEAVADGVDRRLQLDVAAVAAHSIKTVQVYLDGVHQSSSSYRLAGNAIIFEERSVPPKDVQITVFYGVAVQAAELG